MLSYSTVQALASGRPHPGSIDACGPDSTEFFARHGYSRRRLARRCRVHPSTMQGFFLGRIISARLVRHLTKLRAQLDARDAPLVLRNFIELEAAHAQSETDRS